MAEQEHVVAQEAEAAQKWIDCVSSKGQVHCASAEYKQKKSSQIDCNSWLKHYYKKQL